MMVRSSVVLPAPLRPTMAKMAPGWMATESLRSTGMPAISTETSLKISSTVPITSCQAPVSACAAYSLRNSNASAPKKRAHGVQRAAQLGNENILARAHPAAHLGRDQPLNQRKHAARDINLRRSFLRGTGWT